MTSMTHADTSRLVPVPGPGVYDPVMPECLVTVTQLLTGGYRVIFRLPHDCATDGTKLLTLITVDLLLSLIRTLRQIRTIL